MRRALLRVLGEDPLIEYLCFATGDESPYYERKHLSKIRQYTKKYDETGYLVLKVSVDCVTGLELN